MLFFTLNSLNLIAGAKAGSGPPSFKHIDPQKNECLYSAADNALIAAARARGDAAVRVSDVTRPNGRVLRFEVRFGANAGSPKTASTWLNGSPTGIAQVNIDDNNTRMVQDLSAEEDVPPVSAGKYTSNPQLDFQGHL